MDHLKVTLTKDGVNKVFESYINAYKINIPQGNWVSLGPLRLRLGNCLAHLENGTIEVIEPAVGDKRGLIKELDVVWDKLDVHLGVNIPTVCVGGWCIIPSPWGCVVELPRKCFFKSDPDLWGTLPLAGLRNEFSSGFSLPVKQGNTSWNVFPKAEMPLDIDFIDMADMVGNLLKRLVDILINELLGFLPGWARDLVKAILGNLVELIRGILDLSDDVMEWVSEKIGISLGLFNLTSSILLELLFKPDPIYKLENPYTIMEEEQGPPCLPKVIANVKNLDISFDKNPDRIEVSLTLMK